MKYVVVLGDGMADEPIESLGNKTPLEYANTPMMDMLAKRSEIGLAKTVPDGMKPGSDVANLAVLGYNPQKYYSGRSPLEALSIGVKLKDTDIAMRTNIVTLSDDDLPYEQKTMIDHSSSEISTEDAKILVDALKKEFDNDEFKLYLGTSYRHLLIWDKGVVEDFAQPHDILERKIGEYLPKDKKFLEMMKKSYDILNNHPLNVERAKKGLNKANSMWFWGAGTKPMVDSFEEKFNKKGVMISAVDLLKGIAVGAGMKAEIVEGADGTLHTNYEGKANAAADCLLKEGYDFAYIHVEAPDEMGHQGSLERKLKAIENLDSRVIKTIYDRLSESGEDFRILVMPDHPTPIRIRTHSSNPVPYLLFDSTKETLYNHTYSEKEALESGNIIPLGYKTIEKLFEE
ncbi:MAG: cofactor-independent phosphoglycerate mutase [Lachnospiraceae bacterium]|nr:cofactor-independent phosphoglycerate mutase [Lachnospiraceae bacterium]